MLKGRALEGSPWWFEIFGKYPIMFYKMVLKRYVSIKFFFTYCQLHTNLYSYLVTSLPGWLLMLQADAHAQPLPVCIDVNKMWGLLYLCGEIQTLINDTLASIIIVHIQPLEVVQQKNFLARSLTQSLVGTWSMPNMYFDRI